jgi:HlyD family secretion protein
MQWANSHRRFLIAGAFVPLLLGGGYFVLVRGGSSAGNMSPERKVRAETVGIAVEVMSPRRGGIARKCLQPGSIEPFEAADLYSKVSGFLIEQDVDIGYPVKAGDVLARISVPEYEKQVKADAAEVARAEARVDQVNAAIVTAKADLMAATVAIGLAKAEKQSKESYLDYCRRQRDRIKKVVSNGVIVDQVGDEVQRQYQEAVAADLGAREAVALAVHKEAAARARVQQAKADLKYAQAETATARARLEKSQVMLDYTTIRSPYTGVVTKRNFHRGDFIRSADAGGDRLPILAVERTDVMRVIIQVPERDVPFVDCGDPAVVAVDALPGVVFKTRDGDKVEVSRLAASEDPQTRMMRTEVHLKNPDGKLRRGMFGRVTLDLQTGAPGAFRIPSAALSGKAEGGKAVIRLIRDGKAAFVPVTIGSDNGSEVEILSGLSAEDRVIIRAAGPVNDGDAVVVQ